MTTYNVTFDQNITWSKEVEADSPEEAERIVEEAGQEFLEGAFQCDRSPFDVVIVD